MAVFRYLCHAKKRRLENTPMQEVLKKYLKWLLPMLFIGYCFVISLFEHAHVVDGVIVVHSHPFKTLPEGAAHQHSTTELQLFYFLTHFSADDGAIRLLTLLFIPLWICRLIVLLTSLGFIPSFRDGISLRAPPFSISFDL